MQSPISAALGLGEVIPLPDDHPGLQQPTPDVACDAVRAFVKGLLTVDDRLISLVGLDNLMPPVEAVNEAA